MGARRNVLQSLKISVNDVPNVGLLLDRYVTDLDRENTTASRELFSQAAQTPVPEAYHLGYNRWSETLQSRGARLVSAKTTGRMIVGLGGESVLETSISLHHTYGVPIIPGSALKGVAAAYARQKLDADEWKADSSAYVTLFGDTNNAGYVTFFDAWYIPGSVPDNRPLCLEVMTPHHSDYNLNASQPPADWDDPVPVHFMAATGSYLIALAGPSAWVDAAFDILQLACAEGKVGAKSSSGYGRLELGLKAASVSCGDRSLLDAFLLKLNTTPANQLAGRMNEFIKECRRLDDAALKKEAGDAILAVLKRHDLIKRYKAEPWYKEVSDYVSGSALA